MIIRSYRLRLELFARARLDVPGTWDPPPFLKLGLYNARHLHEAPVAVQFTSIKYPYHHLNSVSILISSLLEL